MSMVSGFKRICVPNWVFTGTRSKTFPPNETRLESSWRTGPETVRPFENCVQLEVMRPRGPRRQIVSASALGIAHADKKTVSKNPVWYHMRTSYSERRSCRKRTTFHAAAYSRRYGMDDWLFACTPTRYAVAV